MASDAAVVYEIQADNRPLRQDLDETTQAIERESKKWDRTVEESAGSMEKAFAKALDINRIKDYAIELGKALVQFGKEAIEAASDLREVQNVVDVTFGEAASSINDWAKAAGTQFGLTETQAKRFASTLGAMAKSSGVADKDIMQMSTDLAGLAADMASFYNLDFDTAFEKIRSGLSGATEPLKSLGINMSVANLEAYALSQGLSKTFSNMTQGEQTMLRYQYLMQATADAQGDFARTSDGFANASRRLQTALDTIKTRVGDLLMTVVEPATAGLADFLGALTAEPQTTVLDKFNSIDLDTTAKLAEIEQVKSEALILIETLEQINGQAMAKEGLSTFVASLAEDFGELDGAIAAAKSGDYAGTLSEVAKALELETGASADTWKTLLQAIANNLPAVTDATGSDTSTSAFLKAAADAAAELGGEYPELWDELLTTLGEKAGTALSGLAEYAAGTQAMSEIADAAGKLKGDEQGKWESLLSAIQGASGITNLFGDADSAAKNIKELAGALGSSEVSDEKASAWQTLLGGLAQNADGLSALTGDTAEGTKEWLEGLAEGAKALTADDAEAWNTLFDALLEGLPGLSETDEGKTFLEQLGKGFEAIGETGAEAIASLAGLGSETGGIADRQKQWLAVCKQLVQTIPGLSSIINTETGEITGGTEAVIRYVDEWEKAQRKLTALKAVQAKRDALADSYGDLVSLELDTMVAEQRAKAVQDKIQAIQDKYEGLNWEGLGPNLFQMGGAGVSLEDLNALGKLQTEYSDLSNAVDKSRKSYENAKKAYGEASSVIDEYAAAAEAMEGDVESLTDANNALAISEKEASDAISAAKDALTELQEYTDNARSNVETAVNQLVSGFSKIDTPVEEANKKIQELQDQLNSLDTSKDAAEIKKLNDQINSLGADRPSMQNMTAGLQDQLKYMQEYGDLLDSINSRDLKIDENLLAELADGSADSMDYLRVLASASDDEITKLNEAYQKVQSQKTTFTDQLTAQKLAADEAYDAIVQKANEAVSALDLSSESSDAMSNTVEGMANGIAAALPSLQAQVDAVLDVLSQLEGFSSIGLSLGEGGEFTFTLDGEHANGLDYVPFDNYLAALHEGESILTAEEARVWRRFKDGGAAISNTIDYDAIGGVIRDNSGSGNVYLEGRAVGRIINGNQADQYRSLQRSGWTG